MTNRTSISIPWAGKVGTLRLFLAGAISAAIILPLVLEGSGYQWRHTFLAIVLIEICLYPTVRYFARQETDLPTMPIFSAAFALQFAIPIFTRDATIELAQGETRLLEDSDVTAALLLAIVGICALLAGDYSAGIPTPTVGDSHAAAESGLCGHRCSRLAGVRTEGFKVVRGLVVCADHCHRAAWNLDGDSRGSADSDWGAVYHQVAIHAANFAARRRMCHRLDSFSFAGERRVQAATSLRR